MKRKAENKNFEYASDGDMLYINGDTDEEVMGSLPVGNLVFDVGRSGRITGLEIDNASELLKIPKEKMREIQAELVVRTENEILFIGFVVKHGHKTFESFYLIPKDKISLTT